MSDNTDSVRVRVDRPQFRYEREQYTEDDELEMPRDVAEKYPRSLSIINDESEDAADDEDATAEADDVEPVEESDLDPHPSDLTVDEIRDRVGDVDDLSILYGIRDAEQADKARATAIEAIEARIDELGE